MPAQYLNSKLSPLERRHDWGAFYQDLVKFGPVVFKNQVLQCGKNFTLTDGG